MPMNSCLKEKFSNTSSYVAKEQMEQNCGCVSCIRRCCKPGFIYRKQVCYRNSSNLLKLPIYNNKTNFVKILENSSKHFIVGTPNCILFRLNYSEEFYIQEETKDVWIPTFNKSYNNNQYCVDELNGFTPLLCFSSTSRSTVPIAQQINPANTVGMYKILCIHFYLKYYLLFLKII